MVKGLAVVLATLTRADDEVTMLSMRHASALSVGTLDRLGEFAASRNVTQMALLVENIAKETLSGDGIDSDIRDALGTEEPPTGLLGLLQQIKNSLMDEHKNDQAIVDKINKCFENAEDSYADEIQDAETLKGVMMKSKTELNSCRLDTHDAYVNKIEKCEALDNFIASLQWPKKKEEECIWDGSSTFGKHLASGLSWYQSNYDAFIPIREACWTAVEEYKNVDTTCDRTQSHFEIDTCAHRQAAWTACNDHYSNACKKCSIEFDETVSDVECREKDRKVDWSSAEKIKCYVNVILSSPSDEEVKASCKDGVNCETQWRIEEYKNCENVCHDVDFEAGEYKVRGGVNTTHRTGSEAMDNAIRCTRSLDINFPAKRGCGPCPDLPPYPCETDFVEEFYSGYQQNTMVHGLDGVKECAGYMHQEWSAYSMAECRPCPTLIGHDPQNHDAKCQAYGDEIRIQTDGQWLNLNEISVNGGVPLTAAMSSTYGSYAAANCVDGDANTMCHAEQGGWVSAKLSAPTCIENIAVTNRKDCCQDRIVGGNIKIFNQGTMVWQSGFKSNQDAYVFSFEGKSGPDTSNANVIATKEEMLAAGWSWTGCATNDHGGNNLLTQGIWCHSEKEMHLKVPALGGSGRCTATWSNAYGNNAANGFVRLMKNGVQLGEARAHQTKTVTFDYNAGDKLEFWEGFAIAKTPANWLVCDAPEVAMPQPAPMVQCPSNVGETAIVDERCYFVHVQHTMTIDSGRSWCQGHGGELASIHSAAANNAVLDLLDTNGVKASAWIGALRTNSEHAGEAGTWTWEDGSAWSPISWATDGLNHNGGSLHETRICIHSDSKWHDWTHGTTPKGVVCQVQAA